MIKLENTEVFGWEHAIRGMRNTRKIGCTCVGFTGYEMKLFLKKMKQIGLYSK